MFRLQENIPQIYSSSSRDFQLIEHIYDVVTNAVRFNVKSTSTLIDPLSCSERILPLLCTRVGFFPSHQYNTHALREVIKAFPYIIKNKGSRKGIEQAVNVILKAENNYETAEIDLSTPGRIGIFTKVFIQNELLLRDVLSYIIPIGYEIIIGAYVELPTSSDYSAQLDTTLISTTSTNYNENLSIILNEDNIAALESLDNPLMSSTIGVFNASSVINSTQINQSDRTDDVSVITTTNGG